MKASRYRKESTISLFTSSRACIVFSVTLATLLSSFAFAQSDQGLRVEDDEGHIVILDRPAQRIISLAPSLTELLYAAGAGEKVVAAVEYSDYPAAAQELPRIGRHDMLDMERILALEPDLVITWQSGNPRASINRLREFGLTVYSAEPKSLSEIPEHIRQLGYLAGTDEIAQQASEDFEITLNSLQRRFASAEPVRTFYQIWNVPLMSAGGNELINDIITLCGGENIFADIKLLAPKVSVEAVLLRDPVAIVASGMDEERPEWLDDWRQWPSITAVAEENLFFVPPDLLQRHTPRALEGAIQMCNHLARARSR